MFLNAPTIAFMPWAKYVMPEFIGYTLVDNFYKNMKALFNEIISEHEKDFDNESLPKVTSSPDNCMRVTVLICFQDFIDAYLRQMKKDPTAIERDDLVGICLDFFEAGGDTVGSTLSWVFMYMALHPDEQERCYDELVKQLGKDMHSQVKSLLMILNICKILQGEDAPHSKIGAYCLIVMQP